MKDSPEAEGMYDGDMAMKANTKNTIALLINISIVVITGFAMARFFVSSGDGNMQVRGAASLKYFTNLSNWFMAFVAFVSVIFNIHNIRYGSNAIPKPLYLVKYMAAVSVTVTFLTCVFFLGPLNISILAPRGVPAWRAYALMFSGNTFFLHFITPVLSIIVTIFLEKTNGFEKRFVWLGVIPVLVYAVLYGIMVLMVSPENGGWRDFYHFTFGGKPYMIPVSAAVMFYATWIISKAEHKMYNKVNGIV